jgi:hypothetical protein
MKNWTWEKLKEEVDRGHREFFQRRGMDPTALTNDFLFGKSTYGDKSQSSSYSSDQPNQQSFQEKHHNLGSSGSQMNDESNESSSL